MTDIATRAEQAKPEETRGLLEELILHPRYAGRVDPVIFGLLIGLDTPEAHLAAAMMLVPEGFSWSVIDRRTDPYCRPCAQLWKAEQSSTKQGDAATPALALIAAISKAIGGPHD